MDFYIQYNNVLFVCYCITPRFIFVIPENNISTKMRFSFQTKISIYLFKILHSTVMKRRTDKWRNVTVADFYFCTIIAYLWCDTITKLLNPNTQMEMCVKGYLHLDIIYIKYSGIQTGNNMNNIVKLPRITYILQDVS